MNNKDALLAAKYENDSKFARIYKRIKENNLNVLQSEFALQAVLLNNQDYFAEATKRTIIETLEEKGIQDLNVVRFINTILVNEYFYQRAI